MAVENPSNTERQNTVAPKGSYKFPKSERLHHRTLVNNLFDKGEVIYANPLRLTYRLITPDRLSAESRLELAKEIEHVQMMVTIPKKKIHHAVGRVLLRRRIREAYRLNRLELLDKVISRNDKAYLSLSFIYLSDSVADYAEIDKKMQILLSKLIHVLDSKHSEETTNQPE